MASNSIPSKGLYLDWCSHEAAKFAVEHWHYSRSLSSAKNVYIGVWEDAQFSGSVVFGIGAGAATNGRRFGLDRTGDVAELTRVALRTGHKATVSRIVAIAIRMLCKQSPGIRMVISFADPAHGHHGGIYQAGNWIYAGQTKSDVEYKLHGRWMHHRTATSIQSVAGFPSRKIPAKHRYLMPLDAAMREKIEKLRKPYPKRVKMDAVSAPHQSADESDPPAPTQV